MDLPPDFIPLYLAENTEDNLYLDQLSILPTEILEIIFSHFSPKFLTLNVLPVCRRFRLFLSDKKWWIRQIRDFHLNIQLCDAELENADFDPIRTFHSVVREEKTRKNWSQQTSSVTLTGDNKLDCVKLFRSSGERYCITVTHNYHENPTYIKLWKLDANKDYQGPKQFVHEARVFRKVALRSACSLEMHGTEKFLSGTEDGTLNLWNIGGAGFQKECEKEFDFSMTALSLQGRTLACRMGRRAICLLDVGNELQEIGRSVELPVPHDRTWITGVTLKNNIVYTLFNNQLMILDVRKLSGPVHQQRFDVHCGSMSVADGLIHCGHGGGVISVLQASDLTPCYSFYYSEDEQDRQPIIKGVVKTRGSVLACTERSVRAFSLGSQPVCLGVRHSSVCMDAALEFLQGDVLVGGNGILHLYPLDK